MEIISTDALISINATFFVQLLSFLFFIFALNKVMVVPLRKIMSKRSEYFIDIKDKIDFSSRQLKTVLNDIETKKIEIIKKLSVITVGMEEDSKEKAREIYLNTKNKIISLQKKYDNTIKEQVTELRTALNKDIDDITIKVMEKILDRRLTK